MMNHNTIFLFFCLLYLGCQGSNKGKQKSAMDKSKEEITVSDSVNNRKQEELVELDLKGIQDEISQVALSFHTWYIGVTNDNDSDTPLWAEVVKDLNGKCTFDYEPYFSELKKLNTISEKFMNSEVERNKSCEEYLATIDWDEYEAAEGYAYSAECPQFYYVYWTNSQDVYSGVSVDTLIQKGSKWYITLAFYNDFDKRYYDRSYQPFVTVEEEAGKWMITKIEWIENN